MWGWNISVHVNKPDFMSVLMFRGESTRAFSVTSSLTAQREERLRNMQTLVFGRDLKAGNILLGDDGSVQIAGIHTTGQPRLDVKKCAVVEETDQ